MPDIKMKGNRGEWSELYVFLKLLSEGRIYAANEKIERIDDIFYPILHIMREENNGKKFCYVIKDETITVQGDDRVILVSVPRNEFGIKADKLLEEIKAAHNRTFEVREIAKFANGILVTKICATSRDKTDINLRIEDHIVNSVQDVGFSIKSWLGGEPTLLNASPATNFIYAVKGLVSDDINEINSIVSRKKVQDRCKAILAKGGSLEFLGIESETFNGNLQLVDTKMPEIVAELLKYYFFEHVKNCGDLVKLLEKRNPLKYKRSGLYNAKMKLLLRSVALGLKPNTEWDGIDEANGGYIVVKVSGEVLAYHIYNRNVFEQYLLDHTRFDHGSITKHEYMSLYKEDSEEDERLKIKLNLQIRFMK